jgi:prepilin-type processing-associated H-X9-DG protein
MFYIPPSKPEIKHNLDPYRVSNEIRKICYKQIFRHCKRNTALDEPSQLFARIPFVNTTPNGNVNVLFADGSVDKIMETTGENIPYSMYSGINK